MWLGSELYWEVEQKGVIFDILLAPIKIKICLILSSSFLGIQLLISDQARGAPTFTEGQNPHSSSMLIGSSTSLSLFISLLYFHFSGIAEHFCKIIQLSCISKKSFYLLMCKWGLCLFNALSLLWHLHHNTRDWQLWNSSFKTSMIGSCKVTCTCPECYLYFCLTLGWNKQANFPVFVSISGYEIYRVK